MKKDGNEDVLFIIGLFAIVLYLFGVFACLSALGQIDVEVKKAIYKHYDVPLEDK